MKRVLVAVLTAFPVPDFLSRFFVFFVAPALFSHSVVYLFCIVAFGVEDPVTPVASLGTGGLTLLALVVARLSLGFDLELWLRARIRRGQR